MRSSSVQTNSFCGSKISRRVAPSEAGSDAVDLFRGLLLSESTAGNKFGSALFRREALEGVFGFAAKRPCQANVMTA